MLRLDKSSSEGILSAEGSHNSHRECQRKIQFLSCDIQVVCKFRPNFCTVAKNHSVMKFPIKLRAIPEFILTNYSFHFFCVSLEEQRTISGEPRFHESQHTLTPGLVASWGQVATTVILSLHLCLGYVLTQNIYVIWHGTKAS